MVVNQQECKYLIIKLRNYIQTYPSKGFWVVSFAAYICSPFLTNDGVCLLFVEPLLTVFSVVVQKPAGDAATGTLPATSSSSSPIEVLDSKDAIFFLLTLACSSNIGSALTYTGNPQVGHNY